MTPSTGSSDFIELYVDAAGEHRSDGKYGRGRCSVEDCGKSAWARQWCRSHYDRWQKYGDPLWTPPRPTPAARFWASVRVADVADPDACWLWTASTNVNGYGRLWVDGRLVNAHRFAYELMTGPIPGGLELDHLCRARHCVNPDHLEPVAHQENMTRSTVLITHCPSGHAYDETNTYRSGGRRSCRICQRRHKQGYKNRQRLAKS